MSLLLTLGLVILEKAKAIGSQVYVDVGRIEAQSEYETRMRDLLLNLNDENNPGLGEAVASGDIPVEKFVRMPI
ncbi:hypothetical protein B0H10DRAFT_2224121 [Mycena sp. CBHHK59/15]|nr:hypothetical protein B0H10DRAFT_2224121 [Mycena sp. CBHHK59/15]